MIYKRVIGALAALAVAGLGVLILAAPAQAQDTHTFVGSVTDAPDNHCPTWARDTFTRTTTLTETGENQYAVRQEIEGSWVAAANPAIKGTITGFVEYAVTGTLLADPDSAVDDVDLGSLDCKANAPAESKTGNWALRYFEAGATASGITAWEYTYDTACEDPFVESGASDAMGAGVFTLVCPEPEPTPTADPTAEPTPTVSPSDDPAPGVAGGKLPVTGANLPLYAGAGAAVIGLGVGLVALAKFRRRQPTFTAE